ncbi:MAG: hypothetical protein ACREQ9_16645 [Candidatus Binatia bacterium]
MSRRPIDLRSDTVMVYLRVERGDADGFVSALARKGLLAFHVGGGWIRAVTHLDLTDEDVADAVSILRRVSG